jgi:hypothetical protein
MAAKVWFYLQPLRAPANIASLLQKLGGRLSSKLNFARLEELEG